MILNLVVMGMANTYPKLHYGVNQAGAVLFTGLITLLVLSLVAVSSMQGSTLEQRMAVNINDQMLAFEAAEAAIFEGELLIQSNTLTLTDFQTNNTDGLYLNSTDTIWQDIENGTVATRPCVNFTPASTANIIATAPNFVIQYIGPTTSDNSLLTSGAPIIDLYRITARGTGRSDNSVLVLESTYAFSVSIDPSVLPFLGRQSWRQVDF